MGCLCKLIIFAKKKKKKNAMNQRPEHSSCGKDLPTKKALCVHPLNAFCCAPRRFSVATLPGGGGLLLRLVLRKGSCTRCRCTGRETPSRRSTCGHGYVRCIAIKAGCAQPCGITMIAERISGALVFWHMHAVVQASKSAAAQEDAAYSSVFAHRIGQLVSCLSSMLLRAKAAAFHQWSRKTLWKDAQVSQLVALTKLDNVVAVGNAQRLQQKLQRALLLWRAATKDSRNHRQSVLVGVVWHSLVRRADGLKAQVSVQLQHFA